MVLRNLGKAIPVCFKFFRYAKHSDKYTEAEKFSLISYVMGRALVSGNVDVQVHGVENIPTDRGVLMYANHQGMFDIVAITGTTPIPLGVVFKKELTNVPFVKQFNACTKSFGMDREDPRQALGVIQAVTAEVKSGRSYLIFPEGTRSRTGNQMNPFHHGSFRCAIKAKCPVVPIALIDCFRPFDEKGSAALSCQLHYLKPIMPEEFAGMNTTELAQLVQQRIQETIDQFAA